MVERKSCITPKMQNAFVDADEMVMFDQTVQKLTRWNLSQKRILVMTTERLYLFDESSTLIRKQNISQIDAIIKSQTSNEIVFIFPDKDSKDLRVKGLADEMVL